MKLSEPKCLSRRGYLVRQIAKEEWPVRLGDWFEVVARCDLFADTAPTKASVRGMAGKNVLGLLYRESLIGHDEHSGLWYCLVVAPKQDYPDGWESEAKIKRKMRLAEREALGLDSTPRKKAKSKRKPTSATPPASRPDCRY